MLKKIFGLIIIVLFLAVPVLVCSLTMSEGNLSGYSGDSAESTKVFITAAVVKEVKGNVIYLSNNRAYNLRNVKVTYATKRTAGTSRMAQLIFVEGILKEVVFR